MRFDEELSTDNVKFFFDVFPKYLQLTITTREYSTKPSSKYIFITASHDLCNGVRQLYYL